MNISARDAKDVEAAVQWAAGEGKTLEIAGRGTKRGLGRVAQWDATLDISSLSGVTLYEPDELVLSARAGTPIAEIEALVAAHGQELAFEPIDYGSLLGVPAGAGTLGGVIAANLSGPRRIKAGAARDHFLGFAAVSGRGEAFKSGGRVVKNVTGYDLCKLMAGSWGTLAALTDITIKTLPKAEAETTLLVHGLDDAAALTALRAAMGSSCEVSGAAHLPAAAAGRFGGLGDGAVTALRLEGFAPSVTHRLKSLETLLSAAGPLSTVAGDASRVFWRGVRDVTPFAAKTNDRIDDRVIWRLSVAPAAGAQVAREIAAAADAAFIYDWAGGLIWTALAPSNDGGSAAVRGAVARHGGHATLIRAPAPLRASAVFEPQDGGVAALTKRVKDSFDPQGVLGPGRMWAGV